MTQARIDAMAAAAVAFWLQAIEDNGMVGAKSRPLFDERAPLFAKTLADGYKAKLAAMAPRPPGWVLASVMDYHPICGDALEHAVEAANIKHIWLPGKAGVRFTHDKVEAYNGYGNRWEAIWCDRSADQ
jgi:hypothetical protein